jgi:hypothetical protein
MNAVVDRPTDRGGAQTDRPFLVYSEYSALKLCNEVVRKCAPAERARALRLLAAPAQECTRLLIRMANASEAFFEPFRFVVLPTVGRFRSQHLLVTGKLGQVEFGRRPRENGLQPLQTK